MKHRITHRQKDPLGSMMLDYFDGQKHAYVDVASPTLDMWKMSGQIMFRTFQSMNRIEKKALSLCRGPILDIGAGSGCHTLYLQNKGNRVDALDISPGCVEVMTKRKVNHVIHDNFFALENRQYHTLLMLMNGIGICGSLDGLNLFLQSARTALSDGGQILADSTDLASLYKPEILSPDNGRYYGETQFVMTYKDKEISGDPFEWLYIDFETLKTYAAFQGFACENLITDHTGRYLARLSLGIA